VQIHTRRPVNWKLVPPAHARLPARHARQPDSCGIWAPCLSLRRRPLLAGLHRREALRRQLQGHAQLHRHRARDHRARGATRCT
jgi:hypothetical protein